MYIHIRPALGWIVGGVCVFNTAGTKTTGFYTRHAESEFRGNTLGRRDSRSISE